MSLELRWTKYIHMIIINNSPTPHYPCMKLVFSFCLPLFVYEYENMRLSTSNHSSSQPSEHVLCGPKYSRACARIIYSWHQKNINLDLIEVMQRGRTSTALLGRGRFHHFLLAIWMILQYRFIWQHLHIEKKIYSLYLKLSCYSCSHLLIYYVESQTLCYTLHFYHKKQIKYEKHIMFVTCLLKPI